MVHRKEMDTITEPSAVAPDARVNLSDKLRSSFFLDRRLTLASGATALGSVSPRLPQGYSFLRQTLKALRRRSLVATPSQPPSGLRIKNGCLHSQGFKANPGLEFANAFSVISQFLRRYFSVLSAFTSQCFSALFRSST